MENQIESTQEQKMWIMRNEARNIVVNDISQIANDKDFEPYQRRHKRWDEKIPHSQEETTIDLTSCYINFNALLYKSEDYLIENQRLLQENQRLQNDLSIALKQNQIKTTNISNIPRGNPLNDTQKDLRIQYLEKTIDDLQDFLQSQEEYSEYLGNWESNLESLEKNYTNNLNSISEQSINGLRYLGDALSVTDIGNNNNNTINPSIFIPNSNSNLTTNPNYEYLQTQPQPQSRSQVRSQRSKKQISNQ